MLLNSEVTLNHKSKVKKLLLLKFLAPKNTVTVHGQVAGHKNIFLNSPFHFKTVKTHLHVPTLSYQIQLPKGAVRVNLLGIVRSSVRRKPVHITL